MKRITSILLSVLVVICNVSPIHAYSNEELSQAYWDSTIGITSLICDYSDVLGYDNDIEVCQIAGLPTDEVETLIYTLSLLEDKYTNQTTVTSTLSILYTSINAFYNLGKELGTLTTTQQEVFETFMVSYDNHYTTAMETIIAVATMAKNGEVISQDELSSFQHNLNRTVDSAEEYRNMAKSAAFRYSSKRKEILYDMADSLEKLSKINLQDIYNELYIPKNNSSVTTTTVTKYVYYTYYGNSKTSTGLYYCSPVKNWNGKTYPYYEEVELDTALIPSGNYSSVNNAAIFYRGTGHSWYFAGKRYYTK